MASLAAGRAALAQDDDVEIPAVATRTAAAVDADAAGALQAGAVKSGAVKGRTVPAATATASATGEAAADDAVRAPTALSLQWSGYLQAQYQLSQLSRDELSPQDEPLNSDGLTVRRGRLRATASGGLGRTQLLQAVLEVDGNTSRGPRASVRRAQMSWQWLAANQREPRLAVTAGLTTIPFGQELRIAPDRLAFLERSAGSQAWFTGPVDSGVRIHGALGWFRYDVAAMAGTPLDDRAVLPQLDPTRANDWIARLGAEGRPLARLQLAGGVSWLRGSGLSRGTPASKATLAWQDFNDNGSLDSGELVALPALSQRPSQTFDRWALGADVSAVFTSAAGVTQVAAEAAMGSNMDRGLFVADPVRSGLDQRSVLASLSAVQRLPWPWSVGLRATWYRPDLDLLDARRGELLPVGQRFDVVSSQVTWHISADAALLGEWEHIADRLGRDAIGQPTDLANDRFALRGQLRF